MTQDDIISMAREAGAVEEMIAMGRSDGVLFSASELFRFAGLVAAAEREACARICDRNNMSAWGFARAIRARGGNV